MYRLVLFDKHEWPRESWQVVEVQCLCKLSFIENCSNLSLSEHGIRSRDDASESDSDDEDMETSSEGENENEQG